MNLFVYDLGLDDLGLDNHFQCLKGNCRGLFLAVVLVLVLLFVEVLVDYF
jgi:hypothetical protein